MDANVTSVLVGILVIAAIVLAVWLQKRSTTQTLHNNWQALVTGLEGLVKKLEDGVPAGLVQTMLKKGEVAIDSVPAQLLEYRSTGSSYVGGSQGVSVRIMKGVSYRVGANRGQLVKNPDALSVIDSGDATFTNQRVVFGGQAQTREWAFDKLVDFDAGANGTQVMISVSNRQKVSGLHAVGVEHLQPGLLFEVAVAYANGGKKAALDLARGYLEQYRALEPARPAEAKGAKPLNK